MAKMIDELNLKNFKSFKNLDSLKLKPITIICGTNSCGKSTLLQSILSIKQTIESQANNQAFLSNGKYVHLGTFENLVYEKKKDNIVEFKFSYDLGKYLNSHIKTPSGMPFKYIVKELVDNKENTVLLEKTKLEFTVSLKSIVTQKKKIVSSLRVMYYEVKFSSPIRETDNSFDIESTLSFEWISADKYNMEWKNISIPYFRDKEEEKSGNLKVACAFNNLIPKIRDTSKTSSNTLSMIHFFIYRYKELLQILFSNYSYIGPLREVASRRYIYEDEITEIGLKGENSAYLYLEQQHEKLSNYFFYNEDASGFQKHEATLGSAVNDWLEVMGIKGFGSTLKNELIQLNLDANGHNKTQVNIADVGFGISQIFPIILEGLRMGKQKTLLLEQPEIHLHPKLQMQMADYFLSLALSQKNVIVETHSEHLINRLVRRIVEDPTDKLKDLIAVYFIKSSEDGAFVEPVEIDSTKGVVNWPKDFFDQTASEQEKIILAGIAKRRQKK